MVRHCVLFAFCLAACGRPESDAPPIVTAITGRVLDAETDAGVTNALVETEPFVKQVFTNAQGLFTIESGLQIGTSYRITATKSGYQSGNVNISAIIEGNNAVADIRLAKSGPKLALSKSTLLIGESASNGSFFVSNDGTGQLDFSIAAHDAWMNAAPLSGTVSDVDSVITVTVDRQALPAGTGTVNGSIDVTSNGGSASVSVQVSR